MQSSEAWHGKAKPGLVQHRVVLVRKEKLGEAWRGLAKRSRAMHRVVPKEEV